MKNLAKLNGAKALSKKEQKSINGGESSRCAYDSCQTKPTGAPCNDYGSPGCCNHGCCRPVSSGVECFITPGDQKK